jgi:hypothetical protein
LIVTGLMLATVIFSAAFTTGDTLTESLRRHARDISTGMCPAIFGTASRMKGASRAWRRSPKRACP